MRLTVGTRVAVSLRMAAPDAVSSARSCAAGIAAVPVKLACSALIAQMGMAARQCEKRPLASNRARKGNTSNAALPAPISPITLLPIA